jgi:prophage tail gpP-like protein
MSNNDTIELIIGGMVIRDFESYRVESDLFAAADAWSVTLANPDIKVATGARCQLKVNGKLELNGIVDRVSPSYDKSGRIKRVEGRDLMGLLVDSYCKTFPDMQGPTLKSLTKMLLADIPYLSHVPVIFGQGDKSRAVELTHKKDDPTYTQIKPGQTVFDVLKEKALSKGLMFMSLPDGTLMFTEPMTGGKAQYFLTNTRDGKGSNNIISASLNDDISKCYKTVAVVGQKQGHDDLMASEINVQTPIPVTDPTFPFAKYYVATVQNDGQDPKNYAKVLMSGQKFDGWQYEAKTYGHGQNGKNYQVNAIYHVRDEVLNLNEDLLGYGRTFEMDKNAGVTTTLKLSKLGVLPA